MYNRGVLLSVANYITFVRIFISPIFLALYLKYRYLGISPVVIPYILLSLLAVSELSDLADGYFARKYNQVTDLGKIFDPMADSIARISVFLAFTIAPIRVPILLVFIFIYRDSVISTLRTICALRGIALAARPSGKIKAASQSFAAFLLTFLLIPHSLHLISTSTLKMVSKWTVGTVGVYTLFSGLDYIYANRTHIKVLLTTKSQPSPKSSYD